MYAEPLEVLDALGQAENRSESFDNVSQGEDIELSETYLIQKAFTVSGNDRDVYIESNGSVASESDYEVDLRDGTITWNGVDGASLSIRYKNGPVPNDTVVSELEAATEKIDRKTNTTFGSTETVTHTYDVESRMEELVLFNRPVDSLEQARVNRAEPGNPDDFEDLSLGRSGQIYLQDSLSVSINRSAKLRPGKAKLELKYSYGHSEVPDEISELAMTLAAEKLMENTVLGEVMEGRDDFGTQLPADFINKKREVFSSWTIQRMGEPIPKDV